MHPTLRLRQEIEAQECKALQPYACLAAKSLGREYPQQPDEQRTCFQRDRDRVIHARAFRRLKGKTQVFVAHHGDHYRSRLTHTLEVVQLSRDIARGLGVNEDLAETIGLAHDLGHTPFGHAGETVLHQLMKPFGKHFEHNEQSKRIVEVLETKSPHFPGLNLTYEVRDGLMKHRSFYDNHDVPLKRQGTLEAQIVNKADEIAYQNHDIDDGIRAGMFQLEDLQELALWRRASERSGRNLPEKLRVSETISSMIKIMVMDLYLETKRRLEHLPEKTVGNIQDAPHPVVAFSPEIAAENEELRKFLFKRFYTSPMVREQSERGGEIIQILFHRLMETPRLLPQHLRDIHEKGAPLEDVVKDFIAGMTDQFALDMVKKMQ